MAKILVVDDDTEMINSLVQWLTNDNHAVEACTSGEDALELLEFSAFDIIVLDWTMPGLTGLDVCRAIRARGCETPVLFLTGRSEVEDKAFGLDSGADDYITKPCDLREVSARIRALLRRFKSVEVGAVRFSDLELDSKSRRLVRAGEEIKLPPREFALLEFLMRHRNELYSTEQLARQVWSSEAFATDQTVRTCIKRLRQYIDRQDSPSYISNVHGHGYGLNKELDG
jgi:DNA-binding response OmpR family regulator